MNVFGIHICWQEIQAFVIALPVIGFCWLCFKNWLRGRKNDEHPHDRSV